MVVTTFLITALLGGWLFVYFIDLPGTGTRLWAQNKVGWLVGSQLLGVFIWQLLHVRPEEYNVDESTWIANALAVSQHDDTLATLLTHTTARPLTVLPLLILPKLGLPIDFYWVKVIALLAISVTLWLTYLALRNITDAKRAALFLFPLTVFYLAVQFDDFLAFNSELICNVMVVGGIWLYTQILRKRDQGWQVGLVGSLLGLIPFTKFQAIPGALVVVGFCLYEWVRQRRFTHLWLFTAAGLLPIGSAVGYCLLTAQVNVLIKNYFLYYVHYSYQYSPKSFAERFSPRTILYYYRKQYTFASYWFGLLGLMGVGLWQRHRSGKATTAPLLMALFLWLVSIYETIQAGTNYEHYLNLVLVPHIVLAVLLLYPVSLKPAQSIGVMPYGYLAVAIGITFFSRTKAFERGYEPPLPYDEQVVRLIRQQCGPTDRIPIWGWADRYYALSGVAPASRYANSVFQMKPNAQQAYYLQQYVVDLKRNKPHLFLDAVAPRQFTYSNPQLYSHDHFPALQQVIATAYDLIYQHEGLRAYKLKP